MRHLRGALVAFAAVLAAVVAATPASAATVPPPSLVGEQLVAGTDNLSSDTVFSTNLHCNADESGTIDFHAAGVATGPYPGTFVEDGTVTIGAPGLDGLGPVLTFSANFTISMGSTTLVTGTKTMLANAANEGDCLNLLAAGFNGIFITAVSYDATIHLSDGSAFRDTGDGQANGHDAMVGGLLAPLGAAPPEGAANSFDESFDRSNGVVPVAGTGKVTGGGWILGPTLGRVSFGFEAMNNPNGLHATCTVIDHATKAHIKCTSIDSLVVIGTHATFTGQATIDGTSARYRIDVDDNGEPGTADTFAIQLSGGSTYAAGGTLMGGNIQIHK